jgi:hypothetical protein
MLHFNTDGYLSPHQTIEIYLATLENIFVFNTHRERLFVHYLRWLDSFKSRVASNFTQFIDGSFISKKEFPKDIDFVTFFDYKVYEEQEPFMDKYWAFSLENEGLDSYLVKTFPEEHKNYASYIELKNEWKNRYTNKIIGQYNEVIEKSFLILNFS